MVVQAGRSRGSPSASASTPDADGDSFESGLSPLAKAVPRTRSTGDLSQDTNNQVRMITFQKIIMRLEANPEEILPTWGLMEVGTTRPKQDKTESWDRTVANCGRLPKYWLAQWLVQNDCSIAPLSQTLMDLIDSRDVANVKHMFYLFTLTSATTSIPKPCRESKTLCSKLFTNRLQLIGNPLKDWASKAVDETTGAVDWLVGGAYALIWEGDFAKEVVFITGDRAPIEDVRITKTFEIKDPWDILRAKAQKGAAKYSFADFFGSGTGPHKNKLDKKGAMLEAVARRLEMDMEQQTKSIMQGSIEDDNRYIGDKKKTLKREAMAVAQAKALAASKVRRTIQLGS